MRRLEIEWQESEAEFRQLWPRERHPERRVRLRALNYLHQGKQIKEVSPKLGKGYRSPQEVRRRRVVNAIFYLLRTGCQWRYLPHDFPAWQTVYDYFQHWQQLGVWEAIHTYLREQLRLKRGRVLTPSAAIIDSQSVKTTEKGGFKGYDGAKKVKGRKRHILVDTQGLLLKVHVHAADVMDWDGGKALLQGVKVLFPRLQYLWTDAGYKSGFSTWVEQTLGWTVEMVHLVGKISPFQQRL